MDRYPEHTWHPWRFRHVPRGYWNDVGNQRKYFDWLARELNVNKLDDWYQIGNEDVKQRDGAGILTSQYGNSLITGNK
jgi:hypothetical protein